MKSVLKYPGSKWRIADWIVSNMPPHDIYVDPFFGSGAVFFSKPESRLEVLNDIDGNVVNFFKVCRDHPDDLARLLALTPYAREEYDFVKEPAAREPLNLTGDSIEDARRFAVRCWQGTGTCLGQRTGWKHDVASKVSNSAHHWCRLPERVAPVAERLRRAQIENRDAITIIKQYNTSDTLIYADPPYLGETRRGGLYRYEMDTTFEHEKLLSALSSHPGPVMLSGYDNNLYNDLLAPWTKITCTARCDSNNVRTEVLWLNFEPDPTLWNACITA